MCNNYQNLNLRYKQIDGSLYLQLTEDDNQGDILHASVKVPDYRLIRNSGGTVQLWRDDELISEV